jgi:hypothetical protein
MEMKGQTFMQKAAHRSKVIASLMLVLCLGTPTAQSADSIPEGVQLKKNDTGVFYDIFDQNIYYEGTNYLRLDRLYRALFNKKVRAKNVNIYDEVPDSGFFVNRHAKNRLSADELTAGYHENGGPDVAGTLTVTRGKVEGLYPGFFAKDSKGDEYLLKFDPSDYLEMSTGAEIVGSRFYYAFGFNVPQYTIATFGPDQLVPKPGAKMVDSSGFKKEITKEKLEEFLLFIPWDADGKFRASATKVLPGKSLGAIRFHGRRKKDPLDTVDHKDRREFRALHVLSSWVNNYDVRESNTLDMEVVENGKRVIKHYIIDFNSSLGSGAQSAKPPMIGFEHIVDYHEITKAFLGLGVWEKTWQKRWREADEKVNESPAVGYFDNKYFHPAKFKLQLPQYVFKDLTRADGFWAAKIIRSFTDDDVRAMVKAGKYTNPEDEKYIADVLIERRDIIAKYWFDQAAPLDNFDFKGNRLSFEDLRVKYQFMDAGSTTYYVDVIGKKGKRGKKINSLQVKDNSLQIDPSWFQNHEAIDLLIRTPRMSDKESSPYVLVSLTNKGIARIQHQD